MINLKAKNRVPYGGFYAVRDPLSGQEARAGRFDLLVKELKSQRKANSLPIGLDFEREVEAWVCASYPQECEHFDPSLPRKPRAINAGDVIRGTRVMLEHWIAGRPLEPREEAERRAGICTGCKYNVPISMPCGGGCQELKDLVNRVIGGKGTSLDTQLFGCFICGCELKSAVWTTLEVQCKPLSEDMKAQFRTVPNCWKQCQ